MDVTATQEIPGDLRRGRKLDHPLSSSGYLEIPIYCRRDDYMHLPPTAISGLPCLDVPREQRFDALSLALRMEAALPPPELRIGMNPERGMVAVPTWFWVEGYDGGPLSHTETVLEAHTNCRLIPIRDARGNPMLDAGGRPRVRRECEVETTTFAVDLRLWPNRFRWDFGDSHSRDMACPGQGDCGEALGQPYIDSAHPSPVRHPYQWSSLGANGAQDAYTIRLGITFGAQYRVTVNGSGGDWRGLPERGLTWTASHQVREAQAVLTRP